MKNNFNNISTKTVTEKVLYNKREFISAMLTHKPDKIFYNSYSSDKPLWVITEYLENKEILYYSNAWADKRPVKSSLELIYDSWKIQGLEHYRFEEKRILKRTYKSLFLIEAYYIYCIRYNIEFCFDGVESIFMLEGDKKKEFDSIIEDLRHYRNGTYEYKLTEITEDEYELCIDKFGER